MSFLENSTPIFTVPSFATLSPPYTKNPRHLIEIAGISNYSLLLNPSRINRFISVCFGFPSKASKMSLSVWLLSFSPTKVVFSFVQSFLACVSAISSPFYRVGPVSRPPSPQSSSVFCRFSRILSRSWSFFAASVSFLASFMASAINLMLHLNWLSVCPMSGPPFFRLALL